MGFTDWLCAALGVLAAVLLGWAVLRWPHRPRVRRPLLAGLASVPPLLLAAVLTAAGVGLATVTYCTQHGTKLAMDLYAPPAGAVRPAPFARAVAWIALGGSARVRRSASPLTYVPAGRAAAGDVPPFLLLHGTDDQDMRPHHSQEPARQLAAAGVPVRLMLVQGAGHGLDSAGQRPTPGQLTELVADFFTRSLAPRPLAVRPDGRR